MLITAMLAAIVCALAAAGAFAAANPNGTGEPSQSCGSPSASTMPGGGNSSISSGSPFQGASSAGVYANGPGTGGPGTATGTGHITNLNAVSQYDVACYQVSQH
jgi:hypothetical protein